MLTVRALMISSLITTFDVDGDISEIVVMHVEVDVDVHVETDL